MIQEETEEQPSDMHFRFQQRDYKNELLKGAYREAILCYCKDLLIENTRVSKLA